MWSAYQSLKAYHRRPSEDLGVDDAIAAWCVDGAVLVFGTIIENALGERVETGTGKDKKWEAKYALSQLLDPKFRLPRAMPERQAAKANGGLEQFIALAGQSRGVKRWEYIKPS